MKKSDGNYLYVAILERNRKIGGENVAHCGAAVSGRAFLFTRFESSTNALFCLTRADLLIRRVGAGVRSAGVVARREGAGVCRRRNAKSCVS